MIPGEYILKEEPIICNENLKNISIRVTNTGDRPIQVGSHFHFFEANKYLSFDREKALGHRLDILSGTAKRFEPGETMEVFIIPITGKKMIYGGNNLVKGKLSKEANMKEIKENKFKDQK